MVSRRLSAGRFALGVTVRAALIGVLAFAAVAALSRGYLATALVLAGLLLLLGLDLIRSAAAADRVLSQFVEALTGDGHERPTPAPGLARLAGTVEGALARRAAERAGQQRRIEALEALLDTVPAALLVVDEAGAIVRANRAARLSLDGATGLLSALPGLGPEAAKRLLALRPGAREIVRLGAQKGPTLASVALFAGPGGPARRLIALQSVSADLGAVELKAWQDLVRVLAHELMNSLTPICSLSESMAARLSSGDPELAEAAAVIARRSGGLMDFVERYRNLADVPSPAMARIKAASLVGDLDRLAHAMIGDADIAYASAVQPPALSLDADPALLEQALINLLKNAVEAVRGRPGAAVRLACRLEGPWVEFLVEDNGPGVPTEEPDAMFVPFFTTKAEGSGVGLTLARQIALAHGGRLGHWPRAPHGAVFKIVLPAG